MEVTRIQPKKVEIHEEVLEKCKEIAEYIDLLRNGTELKKFHSSTKWRTRKFYLDMKDMKIFYENSFKRGCHRADYKIDLIDIVDVRKGWKTDTFNKTESKIEKYRKRIGDNRSIKSRTMAKKLESIEESFCFSIIYGEDRKSLDLAANDSNITDVWVLTLKHIVEVLAEMEQKEQYDRWLKKQFQNADLNKNGALNFDECCKLLKQLNVKMQNQEARKIFERLNSNKHDINGEQALDMTEFMELFSSLMSRQDIEEIFERYTCKRKEMDISELQKFLQIEQEMDSITPEKCSLLISTFEQSDNKKKGKISLIGFTHLLMSKPFEIFDYEHCMVHQDMNFPLSHYYIASSHNTYLIGGQLNGESSVEGYIQALKQGCRCVELDCWDGPHDEPIVYHGYTLTTKILLRDVLNDAIEKHAFTASEYPLILSIENHCTESQQKKIAYHLKNILKDKLYLEPVEEDMKYLPSPYALKNKIIIKAKKVQSLEEEGCEDDKEMCDHSCNQDVNDSQKKEVHAVSFQLSDLVNICQAVSFHGFKGRIDGKCYQMSSFSESKAEKLIQNEMIQFINYNTKHLSRIYPSGTRTESSNYKPTPFWNVGCQIVALNYQSCDKSTFINDAKFKQNGNCGYVLKPEFLRKPVNDLESLKEHWHEWTLNMKVISGQYIPKPDGSMEGEVIDPYVRVSIVGHEIDKQKLKTKPVRNNGFNPRWDCNMEFKIKIPDLAILTFTVKDFSSSGVNRKLGVYALPVTSIQNGYRHVFLMDYSKKYLTPSSLFVHVSLKKE